MVSDNGRSHALKQVVERQEVGGYTLPKPVADAYDVTVRLSAVAVEPAPAYVHDEAAADVLAAVVRGEPVDLNAVGVRVRRAVEAGQDVEHANRVASTALELAQARALAVVQRHADDILVEGLRPAYEANLEQARRDAAVLAGHATDAASLITASSKVRAAWAGVRDAGERYRLLRQVWNLVNIAGVRAPEHDVQGQFATFADPLALFPGHPLEAVMPRIDYPSDPVDLALWLVGPAAAAKPWLPSTADRDRQWIATYGGQAARLRAGHGHAVAAFGGRE